MSPGPPKHVRLCHDKTTTKKSANLWLKIWMTLVAGCSTGHGYLLDWIINYAVHCSLLALPGARGVIFNIHRFHCILSTSRHTQLRTMQSAWHYSADFTGPFPFSADVYHGIQLRICGSGWKLSPILEKMKHDAPATPSPSR